MWTDKSFGALKPNEKLLFVGLFSLADDDGRIEADPMFLRTQIFPYENWAAGKMKTLRDAVVLLVPSVHLYQAGSQNKEYIALLKWSEHQKPKYPKPSKIPPPFPESSGKVPPKQGKPPEGFPPRVGLGREGLGGDGLGKSFVLPLAVARELAEANRENLTEEDAA